MAPGLDVAAGEALLERLEQGRWQVEDAVRVPPDVVEALAVGMPAGCVVERERWVHGGALDERWGAVWRAWRPSGSGIAQTDVQVWTADLRADGAPVDVGAQWSQRATLGELSLQRVEDIPAGQHWNVAWSDPARERVVVLGAAQDSVIVIAPGRPGRLVLTRTDTVDAAHSLWHGPAPGDPLAQTRWRIGDVDRSAFVLPAPAWMEWDISRVPGDGLALAIAAPNLGLRATAGVLTATAVSDGLRVSVEVVHGGQTQRAWSRRLSPGDGWVEAVADLSAWKGKAVTLRVVVDPGSRGDARFDVALLAGLELTGPPRPPSRPHVVFVDVDTLRADRVGLYGAARDTTPLLDEWVSRGATLYEDCNTTASWTLPSTVSMLTGLAVHQHEVQHRDVALGAQVGGLAAWLSDAGYRTYGMTEGGYLTSAFGFAHGFDVFETRPHHEPDWNAVLERLDARSGDRPVFLFLQTFLVHDPYPPDPHFDHEYDGPLRDWELNTRELLKAVLDGSRPLDAADRAWIEALYDAGVLRLDRRLRRFLDALDERLAREDLLVIITSDHGEELFERGGLDHGHTLHRELLHVPLIVRWPDRERGLQRVSGPVSSLDIAPTVLAVAGIPDVATLLAMPGEVLPRTEDGAAGRVRVAELHGWRHSVQLGAFKLVEATGRPSPNHAWAAGDPVQLYDLRVDPAERLNRAGDPALADELAALREAYLTFRAEHPPLDAAVGARPDAAVLETLQALGYLETDER